MRLSETMSNNYNLSVSTYVEQKDTREKIDIVKLNAELKEIVAREQVLREEIDKIIAEIEGSNMKRGEKEQNCLECAKKVVFYNNGTLRRDFDGKMLLGLFG